MVYLINPLRDAVLKPLKYYFKFHRNIIVCSPYLILVLYPDFYTRYSKKSSYEIGPNMRTN